MRKVTSGCNFILGVSLVSLFLFSGVSPAHADGGLYVRDLNAEQWSLQKMNKQLCAINYENGRENMLLSVYVSDFHGERAAWIFPIPSRPEKIAIDVISDFPVFSGRDYKYIVEAGIDDVFRLMRLTQIYTLPSDGFLYLQRSVRRGVRSKSAVDVYEHIEKMGLTTEVVAAKDGEQLINYLKGQSLDLPVNTRSVLDEYIGKDYSFVVSWISDVKKFKEETRAVTYETGESFNRLSVFMTFSSDKIFFPMRLTSVYGNVSIPMTVFVTKHVTPEIYSGIRNNTRIDYLVDLDYAVPPDLRAFFNGKARVADLKYTQIKIDAPSGYLTDDLWISDRIPAKIVLLDWISKYRCVWGSVLFVLCSMLSSMFAGVIVFRRGRPSQKRFALFGLWNSLTFIGMMAAAYYFKIEDEFDQGKGSAQANKAFALAMKWVLIVCGSLLGLGFIWVWSDGIDHFTPVIPMCVFLLVVFLIFVLWVAPFIYVFTRNNRLRSFFLLFLVFFFSMTAFFQIGIHCLLGSL